MPDFAKVDAEVCVNIFKAALAILVCGCLSIFLNLWNFPSIAVTLTMCFLPVFSFIIKFDKRLHNTKGATAFTNCTSTISVVSISPNFKRQLLVSRRSTCCKSASNSPSGNTSAVCKELSKL